MYNMFCFTLLRKPVVPLKIKLILGGAHVYVMANIESRLELSLAQNFQLSTLASNLGANVESSEKLIIRVEFLLVNWLRESHLLLGL